MKNNYVTKIIVLYPNPSSIIFGLAKSALICKNDNDNNPKKLRGAKKLAHVLTKKKKKKNDAKKQQPSHYSNRALEGVCTLGAEIFSTLRRAGLKFSRGAPLASPRRPYK